MRLIYLWLLSVVLLCCSGVSEVYAAPYVWEISPGYGDSPSSALSDYASKKTQSSSTYSYSPDGVTRLNDLSFQGCYKIYVKSNGAFSARACSYINRSGDSCADPEATYNAQTGECVAPEPDPCESSAGSTINHQHRIGDLGASGAHSEPPTSICNGSCQYSFDFHTNNCYRYADGTNLNSAFCSYRYKASGTSCTESSDPQTGESVFDQPPTTPPIAQTPTRDSDSSCGAWTTQADGTASRDCTSSDTYKDPGRMECGSTGGVAACTSGYPPPAYTDEQTDQHTETTDNADGSSTTETTTTTTTTGCYGTKPCTTSETTTTETSGTNPDGSPGDSQTNCTGDNCAGGSDDDDPSTDPEEEEVERTATVGDCEAPVSCDGDAIDCALLQQQKDLKCEVERQGDYDKHKTDIEGMFQGEEFELKTDEVQTPSFVNQGTRFLPSSGCPQDETLSLSSNGGHTYSLSYEPLCRVATDFSWLIVSFASLFAAIYVGRSFGGE